jgi:hypothetical protein
MTLLLSFLVLWVVVPFLVACVLVATGVVE